MVQHGSRQDCRGFTGSGIEEKHEIDVGIGSQFSTAIAAQGHQAAMLRPGKGHRLIRFADGIPIAADDESIDQLRKRADNFGARGPVEQALMDGTAAVRQQRPVSFHIDRFEHAAPVPVVDTPLTARFPPFLPCGYGPPRSNRARKFFRRQCYRFWRFARWSQARGLLVDRLPPPRS